MLQKSGMPQFDINQFGSQIFWLILCFAILYIYTIFYTVPRLNKIHQIRWQAIDGKIAHAQQLQDRCAQLILDYQTELTSARTTNQNKVNESIHQLNEQVHQQKLAIDHQIKTQISHEKEQMTAQMHAEMNTSQAEIKMLASELTDQLLNININDVNPHSEETSQKTMRNHKQDIS